METKEGYVEKIIYHNESNGYTVFSVSCEDSGEEETFVGTATGLSEGMYIIAEGEYVEHPTYDVQFKVASLEIKLPDDVESMEKYLSSGVIKGIGEVTAKRIIKKFKMDTFRIIEEEPERLAEIKGISEKKARDIGVQFNEKRDMRDALIYLAKYGINTALGVKIYNEYGPKMNSIIESNPYKIAEDIQGVGFKMADEIAKRAGIGTDSDFRIRAAIVYTLLESNRFGHMYLPKEMLLRKVSELLSDEEAGINVLEDSIINQIVGLSIDGKVMVKELSGKEIIYAAYNYYLELNCARMLLELRTYDDVPDVELDATISRIEDREGIVLDELQRKAVKEAAKEGFVVITGGPGTGKTTTINTIINYFEEQGLEILLAAPTGRAAKRITEATGYKAQTIHRMLELNGGVDGENSYKFERNASNPLETDVIIIDEVSMVDMYLLNGLLLAIMPGTHLIFVGDVNQLPSVGPGNVLKDIITSNQFTVCQLSKIFRQEEGSDIVFNAHKINNGEHFVMNNKSKDFFYLPRMNTKVIIDELGQLLSRKLPGFVEADSNEIQVLTPMRNGDLGVDNLNKELQKVLNPPTKTKFEKEVHNVIFREGDKVMQIKNNYKIEWAIYKGKGRFKIDEGVGVFNGDMGVIVSISDYSETVTVLFDDNKEVEYGYANLDELELAYAVTIHKSQGSEYPAVVIPLLSGPRILMNRNLLYTAVTRAKKCVVIVGSNHMVELMIDNTEEQKRYTGLEVRLQELANEG